MKQNDTQEQLRQLLQEARKYIGHQKEYAQLTLAEECTNLLSAIATVLVCGVVILVILVFFCMAMVYWLGEAFGNFALVYAIFAVVITLLLILFYTMRRRLVYLPVARLMTRIFIQTDNDTTDEKEDQEDEDEQ